MGSVRSSYALNFLNPSLAPSLTFSRTSSATQYDASGNLVWALANLLLNSATLGTQTVSGLIVGQSYTLSFYGTGSVTGSGGWTGTLNGTGVSNLVNVAFTASSSSITFTVSGSVTSAQLEPTSYSSPQYYNPTTSQPYYGPRFDYNPSTLAMNGLLIEQQSTNLLQYSANISGAAWTANGSPTITTGNAGSPDGLSNFNYFKRTATTGYFIQQPGKAASSLPYALSFYAKKGAQGTYAAARIQGTYPAFTDVAFNLNTGVAGTVSNNGTGFAGSATMQNVGGGIYRCFLTTTTTDATTNLSLLVSFNSSGDANPDGVASANDDGYIWGIQLEQLGFSTSYIPTQGSTATRLADSLTNTSIPWFNATRGTMYVEYIPEASNYPAFAYAASLSDGTSNNNIAQVFNTSSQQGAVIKQGGSFNTGTPAAFTTGTTYKLGLSYLSGANLSAVNGSTLGGSLFSTSLLPTGINKLTIGAYGDGSSVFSGWIRNFSYYNTNHNQTLLNTISGQL